MRWWWLWLAAVGLAAAVSPLGAQDGTDCRFSDVPQSSPQQADIIYACQQEWFEGYPDGTFRPDQGVSQEQTAAVINRAFPAGSTRADLASFLRGGNPGDPDGSADFEDVAESHPQNRDIAYTVQQGWFQGYPDGAFRPDRTITPNQIATVVSRAFPAGSTRADLATFMRQGTQVLNALTPSAAYTPRKFAYTVPIYDSSGNQEGLELWVAEADGSGSRRLTDNLYVHDYYSWRYWRWSPDGERIAYQVEEELWVAEADGSGARRLTNDVFLRSWEWSPDGERIGFGVPVHDSLGDEVAYELWVTRVDGLDARRLTNDVSLGGWEWSPDGDQIAYEIVLRDFRGNQVGRSLWVAGADGSNPRQLINDVDWSWWWSPDGERIAYLVAKGNLGSEYELWVTAVDDSSARRLTNGFRWGPYQYLEWSPDGEWIAYEVLARHSYEELWVVAVDGSDNRRLTNDVDNWKWSPDGERIVYMVQVRDYSGDIMAVELWMMKTDDLIAHRLTNDFAHRWAWSPSGEWIAFESRVWEFGKWLGTGLWVEEADGSNTRQLADDIRGDWEWASDGERIIYVTKVRNSSRTVVGWELWVAELNGSGARQLTSDITFHSYRTWSEDQIIYDVALRDSSNNTTGELWVVGLDGLGNHLLADDVVRWWSSGGEIIYTASDGGVWGLGLYGWYDLKFLSDTSDGAWQPRGGTASGDGVW